MKFFILLISLIFLSFSGYSQQLNETAQKLKNAESTSYQLIKKFAVDKWEADHTMIVYEINKQVDAYVEIGSMSVNKELDEIEMAKALRKWSTGQPNTEDRLIDFVMVLYEYKKQMKAKEAY